MKKVAKLAIVDKQGFYLLLTLNNHPTFGNSSDLPGGTAEEGEPMRDAMVREVKEEIGLVVNGDDAKELYVGTDYSTHGTCYALYTITVDVRPEITLSWEHSAYEWLPREAFLTAVKHAKDTYMHMMVHDRVSHI